MSTALKESDHGLAEIDGNTPILSNLNSQIRATYPTLPLDDVILQSVLLCLVCGNKHLILRTYEDDVSSVLKFVTHILSLVLGLSTHKIRLRAPSSETRGQTATGFLRSVLIPLQPKPTSTSSASNSTDDVSNLASSRRFASGQGQGLKRRPKSCKSLSRTGSTVQSRSTPFLDLHSSDPLPGGSRIISHSPSVSSVHASALGSGARINATPATTARSSVQKVVPQALVISGLDLAGDDVQKALIKIIDDKRIILDGELVESRHPPGEGSSRDRSLLEDGIWNVPEEFLVVYVSSWDTRERPPIHRSLLDRFSISNTVLLNKSTRHAVRSFAANLFSSTLSPTLPSISDKLTNSAQYFTLPRPPSVLQRLRVLYSKTHVAPNLLIYMTELLSAVRNHPQLDGLLITARSRRDIEDLARAARVLGGDKTGYELVQEVALLKEQYESSPDPGRAPESIKCVETTHAMLDVSEADVARIMPRVVTHRLRVRDGRRDEVVAGCLLGAVGFPGREEDDQSIKKTIKEILVQILTEM